MLATLHFQFDSEKQQCEREQAFSSHEWAWALLGNWTFESLIKYFKAEVIKTDLIYILISDMLDHCSDIPDQICLIMPDQG